MAKETKEKLTMDSFNEILMSCIPPEKHAELIATEIQTAYGIKIQKMEELVEVLNDQRYCKEAAKLLTEINNIDANCDRLAAKLKELEGKGNAI